MQLRMTIPSPPYVGVYEFENSTLVDQFHTLGLQDTVLLLFKIVLPPLIECVLYHGLLEDSDDDTIYQYGYEIFQETIINSYPQYSSELVPFINDNQTDLINLSVYLALSLSGEIYPHVKHQLLGVRIDELFYRYKHYSIWLSIPNRGTISDKNGVG